MGFSIRQNLQTSEKAISIITCSKYNAHTEPLCKKIKLLKLPGIFKVCILKFYYKYSRKELPTYLQSFTFIKRSEMHAYNSRQKDALHKCKTFTKLADCCLRNAVQNVVNDTNQNVIDKIFTHSLQGYAWYIKQSYINQYQEECTLDHCYICN